MRTPQDTALGQRRAGVIRKIPSTRDQLSRAARSRARARDLNAFRGLHYLPQTCPTTNSSIGPVTVASVALLTPLAP
eukprot:3940692-Rhodomonas_salina.2